MPKKQPKGPPKRKRTRFFIQIVEHTTNGVVKEIGPYNEEPTAERAERGVNINLNHSVYQTRITSRRT